jgi:hypothetical protein
MKNIKFEIWVENKKKDKRKGFTEVIDPITGEVYFILEGDDEK